MTEIRAELLRNGRREELGASPLDADLAVSVAKIGEALAERGVGHVVLILGHGRVQVRRVQTMPAVSRPKLRAILAQQPLRYLRPVAGQLVTDAAWLAATTAGRSEALLAGADAELIDSCARALRTEGVAVDRVIPDGYESMGLDLLPPVERERRLRRELRHTLRLGLALVLVWLGYGCWKLWRLGEEHARLARRLVVLTPAAEAVAAARREVQGAELAVTTLDSMSAERGRTLAALADLAAGLPRDAYLNSALVETDSVQLAGLSDSPVAVVESLSRRRAVHRPLLLEPRARAGSDSSGRSPFEVIAKRRSAG